MPPVSPPTSTDGVGRADCPYCNGLGHLRADVPFGHPDFGRIVPCECYAATLAQQEQARIMRFSGIHPSERGLRLKDISSRGENTQEVIAAVQDMVSAPYGMLSLYGNNGTGKTLALKVLTNEFLAQGKPALFVQLSKLLQYIREGFSDMAEVKSSERYRRIIGAYFLAIDELDKVNSVSGWTQETVFDLFNDRYEQAKRHETYTAVAFNKEPDDCLPPSIVDRIFYGYDVGLFRVICNNDLSARRAGW